MIATFAVIYLLIAIATAWLFHDTESGRGDWPFIIKTSLLWPAVLGMLVALAIVRRPW